MKTGVFLIGEVAARVLMVAPQSMEESPGTGLIVVNCCQADFTIGADLDIELVQIVVILQTLIYFENHFQFVKLMNRFHSMCYFTVKKWYNRSWCCHRGKVVVVAETSESTV